METKTYTCDRCGGDATDGGRPRFTATLPDCRENGWPKPRPAHLCRGCAAHLAAWAGWPAPEWDDQ